MLSKQNYSLKGKNSDNFAPQATIVCVRWLRRTY